jgi:hypothetical protein
MITFDYMSLMNEKEAFSKRLAQLLNDAGVGTASPTHIAREFNLRYPGKPITVQGVRKWLSGEAIPAPDKIRTLSKWLKASPHWLHYGEEKPAAALTAEEARAEYQITALPKDFERLSLDHKLMVCEIVNGLLSIEKC